MFRRFRLLMLLMTIVVGLIAPPSRADEKEIQNPPAPEQLEKLADQQQELVLYGGKKSEVLTGLENHLNRRLEFVQNVCPLDEAARTKLRLAGKQDIKRFVDKVERRKKRVLEHDESTDANNAVDSPSALGEERRDLTTGPSRDNSLFRKTLNRVMTKSQIRDYEAEVLASRRFAHRAAVDTVVTIFDMQLGLDHQQRQQLTALLIQETRLPIKETQPGTPHFLVILVQAMNLPEPTFKPPFTAHQWTIVTKLFAGLRAEGLGKDLADIELEPKKPANPDPPVLEPNSDRATKPATNQNQSTTLPNRSIEQQVYIDEKHP
jgi:hypothetical protein